MSIHANHHARIMTQKSSVVQDTSRIGDSSERYPVQQALPHQNNAAILEYIDIAKTSELMYPAKRQHREIPWAGLNIAGLLHVRRSKKWNAFLNYKEFEQLIFLLGFDGHVFANMLFDVFDTDNKQNIPCVETFLKLCLMLSTPLEERVQCAFMILDQNGIGNLNALQVQTFLRTVAPPSVSQPEIMAWVSQITAEVANGTPMVSFSEFVQWNEIEMVLDWIDAHHQKVITMCNSTFSPTKPVIMATPVTKLSSDMLSPEHDTSILIPMDTDVAGTPPIQDSVAGKERQQREEEEVREQQTRMAVMIQEMEFLRLQYCKQVGAIDMLKANEAKVKEDLRLMREAYADMQHQRDRVGRNLTVKHDKIVTKCQCLEQELKEAMHAKSKAEALMEANRIKVKNSSDAIQEAFAANEHCVQMANEKVLQLTSDLSKTEEQLKRTNMKMTFQKAKEKHLEKKKGILVDQVSDQSEVVEETALLLDCLQFSSKELCVASVFDGFDYDSAGKFTKEEYADIDARIGELFGDAAQMMVAGTRRDVVVDDLSIDKNIADMQSEDVTQQIKSAIELRGKIVCNVARVVGNTCQGIDVTDIREKLRVSVLEKIESVQCSDETAKHNIKKAIDMILHLQQDEGDENLADEQGGVSREGFVNHFTRKLRHIEPGAFTSVIEQAHDRAREKQHAHVTHLLDELKSEMERNLTECQTELDEKETTLCEAGEALLKEQKEVVLLKKKIDAAEQRYNEKASEVDMQMVKLQADRAEVLSRADAKFEKLQAENAEAVSRADAKFEKLQVENAEAVSRADAAAIRASELEKRIKELEMQKIKMNEDIEAVNEDNTRLQKLVEGDRTIELETRLGESDINFQQLLKEMQEMKAKCEEDVSIEEAKNIDQSLRIEETQNEKDHLARTINELKTENAELMKSVTEADQCQEKLEKAYGRAAIAEANNRELSEHVEEVKLEKDLLAEKNHDLETENATLKEENGHLINKSRAMQTRIDAMAKTLTDMGGSSEAP